jgi:hypothetical protein
MKRKLLTTAAILALATTHAASAAPEKGTADMKGMSMPSLDSMPSIRALMIGTEPARGSALSEALGKQQPDLIRPLISRKDFERAPSPGLARS